MKRTCLTIVAFALLSLCTCSRFREKGKVSDLDNGMLLPEEVQNLAKPPSLAAPSLHVPTQWHGTYESRAGKLYVPTQGDTPHPEPWAGVKFRGQQADEGLGKGTLNFEIDLNSGRVKGAISGALGELKLAGVFLHNKLTANLSAVNQQADPSFYGVLFGEFKAGEISGDMTLSNQRGAIIREASFTTTPQK